jgi:hypothetical protein
MKAGRNITVVTSVGEPAGSKKAAAKRKPDRAQPQVKRCTEAIRTVGPTLITWMICAVSVLSASAPQETGVARQGRSAIVTVITSGITVDGLLEEQEWQTAPKIGQLIQREPAPGESPTEHTEVTLLRDAKYLYIGVMCHDSEPDKIIGTQMARDANLGNDDRLQIVLDTYRDQRNAFYFATNPAGALVDGLLFSNGQSNMNWDAIWHVRTRRTGDGWSAEFAIPFNSLSFPSAQTVWGFNIARNIQRKLEDDRWSGARLETEFFQVSEAGEITNLDGITQGIGLDIRPFSGGRWLHTSANGNDTITGKPGLDLFYNFTPNLKMSVTANTDFGETEVDDRQINLSRFSLFFPEKRAFFLEDAGVFAFSNTSVAAPSYLAPTRFEVIPFFSRQIGLLAGKEVPIDFGTKLAGKLGRTDIGLLDVRTRGTPNVSARNFFVGRVKRNLFRQSYIGGILTNGNPALPISSQSFGADLRLATSRFLGHSKNLIFNAYGLKSRNEGISRRDLSYGFSVDYPNDVVEMEFAWREVQENFRPALGFVGRRNLRLLRIGGRYNPRPRDFLNIQQMFMGLFYNRFTRADNGQVESWNLHVPAPIDWHFKSGDAIHAVFWPSILYERVVTPFDIYPGITIPPGEYRFTRWRNTMATASKRRLQVTLQWLLGTYWSGHADEVNTGITYKIPPRFTISFNTSQTFARLPQGNFAARILTWQVNYTASPFLSFSNLVQYDNVSRNLGWQSRARWILRPGNDVFLVFGQSWIQDPNGGYRFTPQESKVSAKVQYTFRY